MTKPPDGIEKEIDGLYRLPAAEFTAARNALAARLKKDGDPKGAGRVAELAKPAASAWAVNAVYWNERAAFDAFLAAAARLASAQRAGGPDAFREAQRERREALQALLKKAGAVLAGAGHATTPATLERVSRTLEALALRGGAPEGVTVGRLVDDLAPPGFDAFAGVSLSAPPPAAAPSAKAKAAATGAPKAPKADPLAAAKARKAAIEDAHEKVAAAEAEVRRHKKAVAEAASVADKARATQRTAEAALSEASQKARTATEAAEKAGFAARQAGTALAEAERAAEAARAHLDRKKREL